MGTSGNEEDGEGKVALRMSNNVALPMYIDDYSAGL